MTAQGLAQSQEPRDGRLPSLDGLRAIAVLLVILFHLELSKTFQPARYLWRFDIGYTGVKVFFVLSGFLITTLLLREWQRTGKVNLAAFYVRRIFRIFPAYYTYLAVAAIAVSMGVATASRTDFLYAVVFLSDYHKAEWVLLHTWSLAVEEQFYLLWPVILVTLGMRRGFHCAAALLVISPALRLAAESVPNWPTDPRLAFETVADALATGCLLAYYRDNLWSHNWYRRLLQWRYFNLIPLAALIARGLVPNPLVWGTLVQPAMNIAIALTIDRNVRFAATPSGRFLNTAPMQLIGRMSYSLYLWQEIFLSDRHPVPFPWSLLGIAAAGAASYNFVEKPFLALRGKLRTARQERVPAAVTPHTPD
jgi:peptidoglycan/LPS O-acetylase OafA/YrhL